MSGNMTVNVDCYRKSCDMCRELLNVYCKGGSLATKALRADAEAIHLFKKLFLKISVEWIIVSYINRTKQCLFSKVCSLIKSAAYTNTDNNGRTRIRARLFNRTTNKVLNTFKSIGGIPS